MLRQALCQLNHLLFSISRMHDEASEQLATSVPQTWYRVNRYTKCLCSFKQITIIVVIMQIVIDISAHELIAVSMNVS